MKLKAFILLMAAILASGFVAIKVMERVEDEALNTRIEIRRLRAEIAELRDQIRSMGLALDDRECTFQWIDPLPPDREVAECSSGS